MAVSISQTVKKTTQYRRSNNTLYEEFHKTSADLVGLLVQNGIVNSNVQAELERIAGTLTSLATQLSATHAELIRWTDRITALELWASDSGYEIPDEVEGD